MSTFIKVVVCNSYQANVAAVAFPAIQLDANLTLAFTTDQLGAVEQICQKFTLLWFGEKQQTIPKIFNNKMFADNIDDNHF